jgi:uncharacterized protein YaiI (UPF0178 family)
MHIWVDADACPAVIKEILYRVAERTKLPLTLVANQWLKTPPYPSIRAHAGTQGLRRGRQPHRRSGTAGDLVITADIPLAAGGHRERRHSPSIRAASCYTRENIKQTLDMRNFMETLRNSGVETGGGPPAFNQADRQNFANQLDRLLAKRPAV